MTFSPHMRARRLYAQFVVMAVLAVVTVSSFAPTAQAKGKDKRVLPQLHQQAQSQPNARFRVIVTRHANDHQADAMAAQHGNKVQDLSGHDGFVTELSGQDLEALADYASVEYIAPDAAMQQTAVIDGSLLATLYSQAVSAPALWRAGQTGAGVGVAVLDTGFDSSRADFNDSRGASRVVAQKPSSVSHDTRDGYGHGTHVAGIIAGNSWNSTDPAVRGKYIGVAPEANLINVKVSDNAGVTYLSDVVNGIEWVIANRQAYNIRVLNLSLVSSVAESAKTSTLDAAVERAWFNGIFVVVAAGNNGANSMIYPPANDPFVLTVGAADLMNSARTGDDTVAPWSSYGITQDGYDKPDIIAPGRYIVSTLAPHSTFADRFPQRIVDGSYIMMSGTSMAAPVVAGIAALAFQSHPEWTNDQLKWVLTDTAIKLRGGRPGRNNRAAAIRDRSTAGEGDGEIDGNAVVAFKHSPPSANQALPINLQLVGPGGATVYNGAPLSGGTTWATANWTTSSWTTSSWTTSSWTTANWTGNSNAGTSVW
ncbi:MAG: hypothetical protein NVS2B7_35700 [Herpetosiphon sp.]